jgi:hypothetical protein
MSEQKNITGDFSRVYIESALSIEIRRADVCNVTTPGDDLNHVRVEQSGDTIKIRRKGLDIGAIFRPRPHANITMPYLHELVLSGASQVTVNGFESDHPLTIRLNGASHAQIRSMASGDIKMEVTGASNVAGDIKVSGDIMFNINGASRVELSGLSSGARLELSGASQARLANFNLDNVDASISGASSAQLKVSGKLDVNLSGASKLEYAGNPVLGNASVSGASSLKHR